MSENEGGEAPYRFEWVAAPEALKPYLNSLYILRVGDAAVADVMPAYSGQLLVVLKGEAAMKFADGSDARTGPAGFMCPLTQAHEFSLLPGTVVLGVSLNFRGWAALTGLPVETYRDRYIAAHEGMGTASAGRCEELVTRVAAGELGEREALDDLAGIVTESMGQLSERHQQVIGHTLDWLSSSFKPEIADLMEKLPYSERQAQRLVARFFGQPPVRLIRRYRAIRAATLLSMPEISAELREEIHAAFYDQAHMIKELRHFTGRTPRALRPSEPSVAKETLGEPGYGSVDLFGGN